jgi:hypothetical protein
MNNAQRFVFSSLLVVLALEFGSFSKFEKIWTLAFTGQPAATTSQAQTTPGAGILPNVHPGANSASPGAPGNAGAPVIGLL